MKRPASQLTTTGRAMRLLKRTDAGMLIAIVVAIVLLIVAGVVLGDQIKVHIGALQTWIGGLGPWGVIVFAVLLILGTSVLMPESVFGVAAGVLFGLVWGMVIAVAANLVAAAFQYALSRWLFRQRVQRAVDRRPSFLSIQRAVMKDQLWLQFLVRLTPINPASISYVLGATGVRFSAFMLACLGLLPHVGLEVYLGHAGEHLVEATQAGSRFRQGQDLVLAGGLVVGVIAIVIISRIARKAVLRAVAGHDDL